MGYILNINMQKRTSVLLVGIAVVGIIFFNHYELTFRCPNGEPLGTASVTERFEKESLRRESEEAGISLVGIHMECVYYQDRKVEIGREVGDRSQPYYLPDVLVVGLGALLAWRLHTEKK